MDFPAPQTATTDNYDALILQIDQLCPLQHFGMLGFSDTGLNWVYARKISDWFKQQLGREQSGITYQLTQLDEADGWCVFPIEHAQVQWLLARSTPTDLPTLRLLL